MSRNVKFKEDWSENERVFHEMCLIKGLDVKFEPHTIDLIPSAEGTMGRLKPTQYTPDFSLTIGERKIIIEVKGLMRGRDAIISKLADIFYASKGIEYYVINQSGLVKNGNKNYYPYRSKGISNRGQKTRTIWELLGVELPNDDGIYKQAKQFVQLDKKVESNKMENYLAELDNKKENYLSIIEMGKINTVKYKEAARKLDLLKKEFIQIEHWMNRRTNEKK